MLTIKHIIWEGGFETLYQAQEARVKMHEPKCSPSPIHTPEFVAFDAPEGVRTLTNGLVYVMNAQGKTVGKYDMRPSPRMTGETATFTAGTAVEEPSISLTQ